MSQTIDASLWPQPRTSAIAGNAGKMQVDVCNNTRRRSALLEFIKTSDGWMGGWVDGWTDGWMGGWA